MALTKINLDGTLELDFNLQGTTSATITAPGVIEVSNTLPIATTSAVGVVKPDGTTITILPDGTISSVGPTLPVSTDNGGTGFNNPAGSVNDGDLLVGQVSSGFQAVTPFGDVAVFQNGLLQVTGANGGGISFGLTSANKVLVTSPSGLGSPTFRVLVTADILSARLGGTLSASNIAVGAAAGTGGTATVTGLDGNHIINVTTGLAPTTGTLITLTFTASRGHVSYPVISPSSPVTGAVANLVTPSSGSATVYTLVVGTALAASTSYRWNVVAP